MFVPAMGKLLGRPDTYPWSRIHKHMKVIKAFSSERRYHMCFSASSPFCFPVSCVCPFSAAWFCFWFFFFSFLIIWSLDEKDMCVVVLYIIGYSPPPVFSDLLSGELGESLCSRRGFPKGPKQRLAHQSGCQRQKMLHRLPQWHWQMIPLKIPLGWKKN